MYKVPCGNNMGHGSSCTEGYLCNACLHIEELEAQLAEKEKLLKEIVPLIPDFNFALEHNPAIANYAYLKAAIKGDES